MSLIQEENSFFKIIKIQLNLKQRNDPNAGKFALVWKMNDPFTRILTLSCYIPINQMAQISSLGIS